MHITLTHYLLVSAALFSFGVFAVISKRNAIIVLMGIELILNSANINFLAFSRFGNLNMEGQMAAIFVIILAAAEAAIALAIVLNIFKRFNTVNVDEVSTLKD
ncbi:MAG: NADH-quinone oxidoreductase subunit NuoK [Bacteroidetes bacterium]|nr:NADH-quinone oxidoreductase subunit NuoK [Bacteroidota bacterium]